MLVFIISRQDIDKHKLNQHRSTLNFTFNLCGLVYFWADSMDRPAYLDFNVALAELARVKDYRSADVDAVILLCDTVDEQSVTLHSVVLVV